MIEASEEQMGDWSTVTDAAHATGVPERTVWNWVNSKRVPSKKTNEGTIVSIEAVKVAQRHRKGPTAGTDASSRPASSEAGSTRARNGAVVARVFDLLEAGHRPVDIVRSEQLTPEVVDEAIRNWRRLSGDQGGLNELQNRLFSLQEGLAELRARFESVSLLKACRCNACGVAELGYKVQCMGCGKDLMWTPHDR